MELKGKADPVLAYRLQKVDPAAAGFARRLDAPMVGRERELSLLRGAFDRAVSDRSCQLFTVLGIGGVGKSRLMAAFADELGERATLLQGRCLPYGDGITFWPIAEAIGGAAGLSEADDAESSISRIAALIPESDQSERIARQVAQVIGVADASVVPEETLWAIRRLLEDMADVRPVTLVMDDIQWAEPTLLELIEYIAGWSVDSPILLVCLARPELLEVRPGWGGGNLNATSISLEPLSLEECGSLVANLLAIEHVDPAVRERIAAVAEGLPLFAEELLAMLVDEGRIVRGPDGWLASGDLDELAVPPTTSALLAARIDRLGERERVTLECASIMGQVFYREALDDLANGEADLGALVRKQFVRPERSDMVDVEAFAFRHLLIRDAAYEGVTKDERARLHERFAEWLERRAPEQDELIGHHLEQAHGFLGEVGADPARSGSLGERAAVHLAAAGTRALDRNDMPATVNLLTRASSMMSRGGSLHVTTSIDLGKALIEGGAIDQGNDFFDDAVATAEAGDDAALAARARVARLVYRWWGHLTPEEAESSTREASEALALFERLGDDLGAAWALVVLGHRTWSYCRAEETRRSWRRAVDLFRRAGDHREAGEYVSWLSSVPVWGPVPCVEALVEIASFSEEARGSLIVEAEIAESSRPRCGCSAISTKRDDDDDRGHQRRRELGERIANARSSQTPGWIELMAGNAPAAERILARYQGLEAIGTDAYVLLSSMHSPALYALGRFDEAESVALRDQPRRRGTSRRESSASRGAGDVRRTSRLVR